MAGLELDGAGGLGNLSSAQKGELMDQVKQQIAVANAQELLTKMTEKCFRKCVLKPGTSLDSSEQKCIAMCQDRFMDSWNIISRAYGNRLREESNRHWETCHEEAMYVHFFVLQIQQIVSFLINLKI